MSVSAPWQTSDAGPSGSDGDVQAVELVWSMSPVLLTVEEAAAALRIGRTRMYQLVGQGHVRSVKIGNSRRVPTEALADYVARLAGQAEPHQAAGRRVTRRSYDRKAGSTDPASEELEAG